MPCLREVTRHVRSKNAGPFWVTVDIFFADDDGFDRYRCDPALSTPRIAALFGTGADLVRRFEVPQLQMIKLSFPRTAPQGGVVERDMHGGQFFVRLLGIALGNAPGDAGPADPPDGAAA